MAVRAPRDCPRELHRLRHRRLVGDLLWADPRAQHVDRLGHWPGVAGTAGLAAGPAALLRSRCADGGGTARALVAQGARPAVHAYGGGDMVAAQPIASGLGRLARDSRRPDSG